MQKALNITPDEFNKIISLESDIIELVASHEKTSKILEKICLLAESMLENSVASIMLKDKVTAKMSIISAPSISKKIQDALTNITPGPNSGSCGNAVYTNEPQYVSDTFKDQSWT